MRGIPIAMFIVWLGACGGASAPPNEAPGVASVARPPSPSTETSTPALGAIGSAGAPAPAPSEPVALPISIEGTRLRCPDDRCRGEVDFRGGIRFQKIDPATQARWGHEAERALVDRGAKFSSERYELPPPALEEVFAARTSDALVLNDDLETLLAPTPDTPGASVALLLRFPDGVVARGEVKLTDRAVRLSFGDWMRGITKGPLPLPKEPAHDGPPRALWVEFPNEVRGSAPSAADLDWVLVFDDVPRAIDCERRKKGKVERASFTIQDVRGRVYERRTGKLVGDKTLPDPGAPKCSDFFQWRDEDIGGVLGMRNKAAFMQIADWAWGPLRAGKP